LVHEHGLNLTAGTMAAAGKYIARSDEVGRYKDWHEFHKPGFFTSETDIVGLVRAATGTVGCRHPITYFVEAADDIVYCSADIEDGIKRGVLRWNDVEDKLLTYAENSMLISDVIKQAKRHASPLQDKGRAYQDAL